MGVMVTMESLKPRQGGTNHCGSNTRGLLSWAAGSNRGELIGGQAEAVVSVGTP